MVRAFYFSWLAAGLLHGAPITIIDLGGFGGRESAAYRINANGVIVGAAQLASGDYQGFYFTGTGALTPLRVPGASETRAQGVNASGLIVGSAYIGGVSQGIVWNAGAITYLGPGSGATAVNAVGQITGGNGAGHAFVFTNGVNADLGSLPGGSWSAAYGINDAGTVAGYGDVAGGTFMAFVGSSQSGLTPLGTLGGAGSWASAINNRGQVVGSAMVASGYAHAFVTSGGALIDLGTLGGANSNSAASGINGAGVIVGSSFLSDGSQHGFVYLGGRMVDLNSFLAPNSGWVLQQANGIDDFGNVVGSGTLNGQQRAFLLDPLPPAGPSADAVPEPGTFAMLGVGGLAWAFCRLRKTLQTRSPDAS